MRHDVQIQANWQVFSQLFQVLPAFVKSLYNLIQAWRTCFLFLLEHCVREKHFVYFAHQNTNLFACATINATACTG